MACFLKTQFLSVYHATASLLKSRERLGYRPECTEGEGEEVGQSLGYLNHSYTDCSTAALSGTELAILHLQQLMSHRLELFL